MTSPNSFLVNYVLSLLICYYDMRMDRFYLTIDLRCKLHLIIICMSAFTYWDATWETVPYDMCAQRRCRSACASVQSHERFIIFTVRSMYSQGSMTSLAGQRRLWSDRGSAGWSETSQGAHFRRHIFSRDAWLIAVLVLPSFLCKKMSSGDIGTAKL